MASTYKKYQHDISITCPTTSDKIGMMLVQDPQTKSPVYQVFDDEYLAQQYFTGVPGYGNLPPEKEIACRQDDWRSGFGLEYYDAEEPKRYYSAVGCDLRHRGQAILSWGTTGVTLPTGTITTWPTFLNLNMESSTVTWSVGARDAGKAHSGTYSLKINNDTGTQSASNWTTDWQSKAITVKCWIWGTTGDNCRVRIFDGVDRTSVSGTQNSAWEEVSVTRTLDAGASELTIELHSAAAMDAYFDDVGIFTDYVANPVVQEEFNGESYMALGNVLTKLKAGGAEYEKVINLPDIITDLEQWGDYLFIAMGTDTAFQYINTSNTRAASTMTYPFYEFFANVHGASPTLYGNDGTNTIRSSVDPINGGTEFSNPATTVDSSSYSIIDLKAWKGTLYIRKTDTVYYLDSSGDVQDDLCPELESLYSSTFAARMFVWRNKLYIPCGDQSILETDATTNTFLDPADYCTNLSDFVGEIFGVSGDERYLYVAIDNSTKVEIVAGRSETIDGTTGWVWHPLQEITLTGCEYLHVSTKVAKRLWIASNTTGEAFSYMPLPATYGNITSDTNRSFKTDGYFITPWLHGNFKADQKAWIKVMATLGHSYSTAVYWECHYEEMGSTWADIGDFIGTSANRVATKYLTTWTPTSPYVRLKFFGKTNSTNSTPILLNYDVRAILYPPVRSIIACTVRVCDNFVNKQQLESGMAAKIKTTINNAYSATWPVTITDIDGATKYVKFLPIKNAPRYQLRKVQKDKTVSNELWANLLLQEVTLS